jgi:hypothetical protein
MAAKKTKRSKKPKTSIEKGDAAEPSKSDPLAKQGLEPPTPLSAREKRILLEVDARDKRRRAEKRKLKAGNY